MKDDIVPARDAGISSSEGSSGWQCRECSFQPVFEDPDRCEQHMIQHGSHPEDKHEVLLVE